ncbi:MAG TPA: hypothetical protein VJT32_00360 [bacterium]|nr:hypothetical protein [bacterium]
MVVRSGTAGAGVTASKPLPVARDGINLVGVIRSDGGAGERGNAPEA